ncbi:MAG: efflux RND transporter periplasmic adaptor subunit [Deltaproteobacteria bacterium]|nr:efflux RND transporter periplasmic adaptor subunit [Deltaproteobacteria bacterium]
MNRNGTRKEPLKFILAAMVLSVLLATVGCGSRKQAPPPPSVPEVAVVTVRPEPVELTTELPGRTSAYRVAEIRPQVNGIVLKRMFNEGDEVKAGDVLYQIDPAPYRSALANAEAALSRAEANLPAIRSRVGRYKELVPDKAVSQQDYEDAAAALKQAEADVEVWKAAVETARINLAYTRVTAPIPGRIGRSNVTEGALATAHQPLALATIQQLDPIYMDVPQSTAELLRLKGRLKTGHLDRNGTNQKKVLLVLEDGTTYSKEGTLQFQDVTVDPTTGSVILRVVFPNPQGDLLPGMFERAVVKEGVNRRAILIPQQSVSRDRKGDPSVLIVDAGDKVQPRMIEIDRAIGDKWLVSSGLSAGDRVIVEGLQRVRPGASVKIVPFEAAKPK